MPTATPTPSPTTFRYTTYDTTGAVAEPGSYAFLADPADSSSVVTTYEGLRDGTAMALRIHATDADGVSRAAFLDTVEVGDLFEWRQAEDCFVRYTVTELLAEPSGTPRRLLGVEWMTYAFTGCSGAVPANAAATVDWGELPDLGGTSLTVPVVHGIYQIVPAGWKGATVEALVDFSGPDQPKDLRSYRTLAEARLLPYWRDPALPEGWILEGARIGFEGPRYGYCATFRTEERTRRNNEVYRNYAFDICGLRVTGWYHPEIASWHDGASVRETRVVAGRPALVIYSPAGPDSRPDFPIGIWVYDQETEADYYLGAADGSISGSNIEAALAIARGLFEPPNPPSPQTTFRYTTYDTTGAVAEPGSYAFLADPADGSSVVTTYEGLRDGTARALRIHATDADGVSRAAFLDTVEVGDLFQWRQAEDCFVRYTVTEVKPEPSGTPRRLLGVEWMTYAFTGCSGPIAPEAGVTVDWGELPNLGGVSLTVPAVHGIYQQVPEGWTGAVQPGEVRELPPAASPYPSPGLDTEDLSVARTFPYWRDPALPTGWTFSSARSGGSDVSYGYCAAYASDEGHLAVRVCGEHAWDVGWGEEASWLARGSSGELLQNVVETRTVAGRAALAAYSPLGPNHSDSFTVTVRVHDAATQSIYTVFGFDPSLLGSKVAGVTAIARSLFEPPNPQ